MGKKKLRVKDSLKEKWAKDLMRGTQLLQKSRKKKVTFLISEPDLFKPRVIPALEGEAGK